MLAFAAIAVMAVSLVLIPLGLPGLWIMIAVLLVGAVLGQVGIPVLAGLVFLAAAAELLEFLIVRRLSARWGGSRRAFWGALAGGIVGVVVGLPVPIVGSLLAGLLGTFVGAAVMAWLETRDLPASARVGWGALLGRALAAAVKTGTGVVILVVGAGALVVG